MEPKWKIYLICLFSYSTIHGIRTLWSAIKSDLKKSPFEFQIFLLGALDMLVLFVLAISMNLLGSKIEVWGAKRTLVISMACLVVLTFLIGLFLTLDLASPWLYIVFFSVGVGLFSSVGWPSCLCVLFLHYIDGIVSFRQEGWHRSIGLQWHFANRRFCISDDLFFYHQVDKMVIRSLVLLFLSLFAYFHGNCKQIHQEQWSEAKINTYSTDRSTIVAQRRAISWSQ